MPRDFLDPRATLSDVQEALSAIAKRARDSQASDIDVAMAKVFADSLKYLTPALEASMMNVQKTDKKALFIELLKDGNDDEPPGLPRADQRALPRGDAITISGEALESP